MREESSRGRGDPEVWTGATKEKDVSVDKFGYISNNIEHMSRIEWRRVNMKVYDHM